MNRQFSSIFHCYTLNFRRLSMIDPTDEGLFTVKSGDVVAAFAAGDCRCVQLDDGWPESVEEQGLLLLVWRHIFTNNIWKMCYRQSRRGVSRQNSEKCKTIVCIANTFTHRSFYTQTLLHTQAFTHRSFYTQKLLHRGFYTQSFYPQKLLHTEAFTYGSFYTQTLLQRHFYTQKCNAKGLPTNSTIQKSVTPNALEMLTVMFARTVQVANKKCSCQPQQRNVILKCYPQTPQPQHEWIPL